jgi:hypothetical protein
VVEGLVADAIAEGAKLRLGGKRPRISVTAGSTSRPCSSATATR